MIKWHLETRKIKDLTPNPKNPRQLSKDQERQLAASLDKFGIADKPVINTDGSIIGGHMRVRILKKQGIKEVECWVPERQLSINEEEELNIRLNKNNGAWDFDILANEWEIPDLINWGFDPEELELGSFGDEDTEPKKNEKKLKVCPQCGHGF